MDELKGEGNNLETRKGFSSKLFYIIICVLIGAIIIMIVAITLTRDKNEVEEVVKEDGTEIELNVIKEETADIKVQDDCTTLDNVDDITRCIGVKFSDGTIDIDAAASEYNKAIDSARKAGDYNSVTDLMSSRNILFSLEGRCDEAIRITESEQLDNYDDSAKMKFYNVAFSLANDCGNSEFKEKYNGLLEEYRNKIRESDEE